MDDFRSLLLDVWREACRHIEIEESTATIARLLARHMPIDRVGVLAFDWPRARVLERAVGLGEGQRPRIATDRELDATEQRALRLWAEAGHVTRHPSSRASRVAGLLLPEGASGSWLLGPLSAEGQPAGALVVRTRPPGAFEAQHERMVHALLEPFGAALENDRRVHELAALREAAEADKMSALARLGRTDLHDAIVGTDAGLRAVMERVALVARSDLPVLLLGETGTGKEVVARTIHEASPRARAPFIRVNCGAVAPDLLDSELFGHERGAFTGATSSRRGWFERADEGTLLLDEIGELSLPAQVRLLRVVQEGSFERVGGERPVHVDVRIIAATHRDLPAMVQNGRFREDLWYRIAGFPIVLPPLRERRGDVLALAEHFAERAARRFGLKRVHIDADGLALLLAYDWPGNVRELASVIDRAAVLGDGHSLKIATALGTLSRPPDNVAAPGAAASAPAEPQAPIATLDQAVRGHVETALAHCRGRIEGPGGVAKLLGINPHTLRARMRKLGVDWRRFRPGGGDDLPTT